MSPVPAAAPGACSEVAGSPRLSIALATTEGWPDVKPCIDSFASDAERLGAELVVADGSALPAPPAEDLPAGTVWIRSSARTVFQLFGEAFWRSSGEVVASIEDHCRAAPGWCDAILRAHAEHPEAAAIGGAIENGSATSLLDWGCYFITQGAHMAPLGQREVEFVTNEANLSQKRRAVEQISDNGGLGVMMILHTRALRERGEVLRVDDRFAVYHDQEQGVRATSAIQFHNGRTIGAFRRRIMEHRDWIRLAVLGVLPAVRVARMVRLVLPKRRHTRELAASLPWAVWLEYCQAAGMLLGYATGPGDSPRHLR